MSASAIGTYVRAGTLAGAVDAEGRINQEHADQLLAAALTRPRSTVPVDLAAARRRKAAAAVGLLRAKVTAAEDAVDTRANIGSALRAISLSIAKHFALSIASLAKQSAGQTPLVAFELLTDGIHARLTEAAAAGEHATAASIKARRHPNLRRLTAVQLATRQSELHARRLEVEQQLAEGAVLNIEAAAAEFTHRLAATRQKLLSAPTRLAPYMLASGTVEAAAAIRHVFAEAVDELACFAVSVSELRAAA